MDTRRKFLLKFDIKNAFPSISKDLNRNYLADELDKCGNFIQQIYFNEIEDLLPSCNPLEFDQDFLMMKADLKLRHNGISKSWNLITSFSSPKHQFTKEQIMEYIDGDEDFDFLELHNRFLNLILFLSNFDFFFLDRFRATKILVISFVRTV